MSTEGGNAAASAQRVTQLVDLRKKCDQVREEADRVTLALSDAKATLMELSRVIKETRGELCQNFGAQNPFCAHSSKYGSVHEVHSIGVPSELTMA